MADTKHAGGRPHKSSLEMRGKTWHARLTTTVEGESVRKWFDPGPCDSRQGTMVQ
ncbi:MAG: hypothetical protein ABIQ16_27340 [Polyangiaceae bacterium]